MAFRFLLVLTFIFSSFSSAEARFHLVDKEAPSLIKNGFFSYNVYQETRDYQIMTFNTFLNFHGPLSYFSFVDLYGRPGADFFEMDEYFMEHNLMLKLLDSAFDLKVQWQSSTGDNNEVFRFGPQVRVHNLPKISNL